MTEILGATNKIVWANIFLVPLLQAMGKSCSEIRLCVSLSFKP